MNEHEFVRQVEQRARQAFAPRLESGECPGLVAGIARGEARAVFALGHATETPRRPMQRDAIFRIASMTKPLTAVAAMMLIEERKLRLYEPISRLLPELAEQRVLKDLHGPLEDTVAAHRAVTVEDLLNFTFGMGLIFEPQDRVPILKRIAELELLGFGPPDPSAALSADEFVQRLGTLPLMAQPGERFLYNTGAYVLGVLVARAAGTSLANFFAERILHPLAMRDTGFFVPQAKRLRLVDGYRPGPDAPSVYDAAASSAWCTAPRFEDGGAGLVSSVDDYLEFSRFLLREGTTSGGTRLLTHNSVAAMRRNRLSPEQRAAGAPVLSDGQGWGYGMGVIAAANPDGLPVGAYGWAGGLGTSWTADPHSNTSMILLTNLALSSPQSFAIHRDLWLSVKGAHDGT